MEIRLEQDRMCAGDRLTGIVKLGREAADCCAIVIRLVRTATVDGRATDDSRELFRISRPAPGQPIAPEIPFAEETSLEPPTYHGRLLRIDHSVVARAEFAGGPVLDVQTPFLLLAAAVTAPAAAGVKGPVRGGDRGTLVGLALILFAVVLVVGSRGGVGASIAGAINALIGAAVLAAEVRRRWWGRVAVHIEPNRPELGSDIILRMELRPRWGWTLRRAEATLEAEEVVEVPDPDGHTLHHERVLERRTTIFEGNQSLQAGSLFPLEATLVVPADAPPTFRCPAGRLEWQVRVRLNGYGTPWEDVFPIVVLVGPRTGEDRLPGNV